MSERRSTAAMEAAPTSTAAMEAAPTSTAAMEAAVLEAVSTVCDPEYPEITIAELGILECVAANDDGDAVRIELVPTMLGCPALDVIARDVAAAARSACMGSNVSVDVVFVADPVWTPDRIAPGAVDFMAREYSVAVRRAQSDGLGSGAACPICGNGALEHRSDFGPTPCRSVEWCPSCRNPIEVVGRVDLPAAMGAASARSAFA
ncbi:iron-sulfur cluster assembly protein [Candidatus Poriferisodalis sp.]|uniref:PaaD-like zinc ribbon domain-containing protein n=1 Tax=Candidatus Poriferisodalis sp. TaxID=3101277 RepID=UPI003B02CE9B